MKHFLPPYLFVVSAAFAVGTGLLVPILGPLMIGIRIIGVPIALLGIALTIRSAALFGRAETNIKTFDDPNVLVSTGAFRLSRNPMYLGFTLALTGISLLVGSLSALAAPLVFWLAADRWYIPFEENRMTAEFGASYDRYCAAVPRWLGPRQSVPSSR